MKIVALIVFVVVQILFIPIAIIGIILQTHKQLFVSKKLGVSQTAVEVLNGRWAMDRFDIREESATIKLARSLPNNSIPGMWLALFPLYLYHMISGKNWLYPTVAERGEEGLGNLMINRTLYVDEILDRAKDHVDQFVIMGAGFDTRCYGHLTDSNLTFFELDQAKIQRLKRESLRKSQLDTSHVRFVEVDFATKAWAEKLEAAGYDPNRRALFLWEGVTLYLGEKDGRNTLRGIKTHAAAGSVGFVDFYAKQFVTGELFPGMKTSLKALKLTDEELGFGIDFSSDYAGALETFIKSEELQIGDTYFMGAKTKKGTWMVVAEVGVENGSRTD